MSTKAFETRTEISLRKVNERRSLGFTRAQGGAD